jgi:transcription elongation GreA/GreB family factor
MGITKTVSRAFVKEHEDAVVEKGVVLPTSQHPYYVTPEGMERLRARLVEARATESERDVTELEEKLARAIPIDPAKQPKDVVKFGATVEVEAPGGKRSTYTIVGEDEAHPMEGTISWLSPLAHALDDAHVGQRVVWLRPAGHVPLRVISIRYE